VSSNPVQGGVALYHNYHEMKTERKMSCLNSFIDWLPDNTILCAHNCKRFDATIIVSEITSVSLMTNFKRKQQVELFVHHFLQKDLTCIIVGSKLI
jgi:hypothetical protein